MIAKGASRNNPRQLAVYLMRVERYDTGEPAELLELQSGWAASLGSDSARPRIASRMIEAFRDWQLLTEGTKQGRDGLYHAEISPEAHYAATMRPEQWKRAADILGEELGLQGQPRAVVLHGGTDGRKHLHVVWARTDVDTMKIISDGYNYAAQEKASLRMELEFGHEIIPGKHAKRDREKQPEFPRQDFDYAEAQMAERSPRTVGERMKQIRALQAAAENGQEFQKGLEDAGYVLAQGDRGYIVVDEAGVYSALSKNLQGVMKKAEVEAFMADVPLNQLPTIDDARARQKEKALSAQHAEQSHRAELTDPERKEQITTLRKQADTAQAFKNALEENGFILARGDKRGYVLVDDEGAVFSLSRYVTDIKGKEFKTFMASLDAATLPDVEQAKTLQAGRAAKAKESAPEASKFLSPEHAERVLQPPPVPEKQPRPIDVTASAPKEQPSKFLPPEMAAKVETPKPAETPVPVTEQKPAEPAKKKGYDYGAYSPAAPRPVLAPAPPPPPAPPQPKVPDLAEGPKPTWIKERVPLVPVAPKQPGINFDTYAPKAPEPAAPDVRDLSLKEDFKGLQPPAPQPPPKPEPTIDPEIEVLRQKVFKRQQAEYQKFVKLYAAEQREKEQRIERMAKTIAADNVNKMEDFGFQQQAALQAELERHAPGKGVREALRKFFKPEDEKTRAAERQEELDLFRSQQAHDRRAYIKSLEESRDSLLNVLRDDLKQTRDRHLAEQRQREKSYDGELERRLRERQEAIDLAREHSEWAKDFEKEQEQRWDDPDVPRRGK